MCGSSEFRIDGFSNDKFRPIHMSIYVILLLNFISINWFRGENFLVKCKSMSFNNNVNNFRFEICVCVRWRMAKIDLHNKLIHRSLEHFEKNQNINIYKFPFEFSEIFQFKCEWKTKSKYTKLIWFERISSSSKVKRKRKKK